MLTTPLTPRLHEILLQHLQVEEDVLLRLRDFAEKINQGGFQIRVLTEQQAGLSQLMGDLFAIQLQRQALFSAIARLCGGSTEHVTLSRIRLESADAKSRLDQQRDNLVRLAHQVRAGMQMAEATLRGWSGITNFVLGELLGAAGVSDRYTATGQRMTSPRAGTLDVRT